MEKLLDALASMRKDFMEEFEEDSELPFSDTANWEDNISFYAGLDRGIELAMQEVYERKNNEKY